MEARVSRCTHAAMLKRFPKHRNIKYLENGLHRHATHVLLKYTSTGGYAKNPSIHSSPRRTPAAEAAVPGGWIDLTREGFCYANIVSILSFSVVAQSLVN